LRFPTLACWAARWHLHYAVKRGSCAREKSPIFMARFSVFLCSRLAGLVRKGER